MESGAYATKGANYVKFTNGLIIQWGGVSDIVDGVTVTFHIPFSNTHYVAFITPASGTIGSSDWFSLMVTDHTVTSCKVAVPQNIVRSTIGNWITIGY